MIVTTMNHVNGLHLTNLDNAVTYGWTAQNLLIIGDMFLVKMDANILKEIVNEILEWRTQFNLKKSLIYFAIWRNLR